MSRSVTEETELGSPESNGGKTIGQEEVLSPGMQHLEPPHLQRSVSGDMEKLPSGRPQLQRSAFSVPEDGVKAAPPPPSVVFHTPPLLTRVFRSVGHKLSFGDGLAHDNERVRSSTGAMLSRYQQHKGSGGGMALYEDEPTTMPLVSSYLHTFTMPGPIERAKSEEKQKKADLGVVIGVYLPTIQHIFGVLMFLRLFWIVGSMGILQAFGMVFLCCLCTFLTSISMSAIATNGVVESGGSYFMISRNLGPEFGSAVGILFYLANTVATAMYLVGGVEIFLLYIVPGATIGGEQAHGDTGIGGAMANNFRLYASLLLVIEFAIVAAGVRFVQLFAPVSLCCVLVSVLAIYAGVVQKTFDPESGPKICLLDDHLLKYNAFMPVGSDVSAVCSHCLVPNASVPVFSAYCGNQTDAQNCADNFVGRMACKDGIPGVAAGAFMDNLHSSYMKEGETTPGVAADAKFEVSQEFATNFFVLLAIYFPSVTGIMTGSNMSGDLKDAQKSIPTGTIAAQLTTSVVYLSLVFVFGSSISGPLLRDKYGHSLSAGMVVAELAWPSKWVLLIGSFTSTFGAALQCLCSAPRLLQSIAKDNVIPILSPFSVVTKRNEPFRGLLLTTLIAELAILIGGIDYIAPIVDFFFLMCYAFVNLVCALHSLLGAPNWRPRFRFYHWALSLVGAALCLWIMFFTHWHYALLSIALCVLIYKYVEWKGAKKEWGDGIRGLALSTAQYSLMKIVDKEPHPKNWRPQLLVLMKVTDDHLATDACKAYRNMFHLASQLKAGKGLTLVVSFLAGDATDPQHRLRAQVIKGTLLAEMEKARLRGFVKVLIYEEQEMASCVSTVIQSIGIGGLKPNTILVGWPTWRLHAGHDRQYWDFLDKIHRCAALDMCLIVPKGLRDFPEPQTRLKGHIDVWWILHDGGLLLLLSFLLNQHKVWRGTKLRLFAVAQASDNSIKMREDMQQLLYHLRIDAVVRVVELTDPEISAYAYEMTLRMEERNRFIHELGLSNKQRSSLPQIIYERSRGMSTGAFSTSPDPSPAPPTVGSGGKAKKLFRTLSNTAPFSHRTPAGYSATDNRIDEETSADDTALQHRGPLFKLHGSDGDLSTNSAAAQPPEGASISKSQSPLREPLRVTFSDQQRAAVDDDKPVDSPVQKRSCITDVSIVVEDGLNVRKFTPLNAIGFNQTPNENRVEEESVEDIHKLQHSPEIRIEGLPLDDALLAAGEAVDESASDDRYEYTFTPATLKALLEQQEHQATTVASTSDVSETHDDAAVQPQAPAEPTPDPELEHRMRSLDRHKVKKMHTAVRLNRHIRDHSADAQLVVLNLPRPPKTRIGLSNYMEYIDVLTEALPRVLLIRGTGKEVITMYS